MSAGRSPRSSGLGDTGNGLSGARFYDGRKRGGQNVLDRISSHRRVLEADFDSPHTTGFNQMGSPDPLVWEGIIAEGDSGGPVFLHIGKRYYVAGVNSWGETLPGRMDGTYGTIAGFTRVSVFNGWINSVLANPPALLLRAADFGA